MDNKLFTVFLVNQRVIAVWTCAVVGNITIPAMINWLYFIAVSPFKVWNVIQIVPFFVIDNRWEFINLKFLIFWGMRIVKRPLLKRNISADEAKKPADLFLLVLNYAK